jgi:hypothetical protein
VTDPEPRISVSAIDVTWSLNSDVMAAMRTPPRPNRGLIFTGSANPFQWVAVDRIPVGPVLGTAAAVIILALPLPCCFHATNVTADR